MFSLASTLCCLIAAAPVTQASEAALTKLLPANGDVKGWDLFTGTKTYSPSADKLYLIYDGGDGRYMDAGCVEAITQAYRNADKKIATLTVHRMADAGKAKAFYETYQKRVKAKTGYKALSGLKTAGHLYVGQNTSCAYGYHTTYVVTVEVVGKGVGEQTGASLLLRSTLGKIK